MDDDWVMAYARLLRGWEGGVCSLMDAFSALDSIASGQATPKDGIKAWTRASLWLGTKQGLPKAWVVTRSP